MPAVVEVRLWGLATGRVPHALVRMGTDRRRLRGVRGLEFAKLLGTGAGRTFTPRDADPRRWGLLTVWADGEAARAFDAGPVVAGWRRWADEEWVVHLRPLASRGRWSGREPFGRPAPRPWDGPVAAVTRARLSLPRAGRFWRAVPPVAAELRRSPGLLVALGIGEAPLALQGTFSTWDGAAALNAFAHTGAVHAGVARRTADEHWYAEELFARFAVLSSRGTLRGRDPLAAALSAARPGRAASAAP